MGKILGALTGGLLGGGRPEPQVQQPQPVRAAPKTDVDPNRSEGVAEARRRRLALAKRTGRSGLRTDLTQGSSTTRSGINIV